MKISYTKFSALMSAVRNHLGDTGVSVYDIENYGEGPVQFGVNWCAMGTRTVAEAKEFAGRLRDAARLAETLTRLEIECEFDDWKFADRQEYKDFWQDALEAVRRGSLHGIKEAISR